MMDHSYWLTRISSKSKSSRNMWKDLDVLMYKSDDVSSSTSDDDKQPSDSMEFLLTRSSRSNK